MLKIIVCEGTNKMWENHIGTLQTHSLFEED